MDEQKISFITCVEDEAVYRESRLYLEHLHFPAGLQAEYIPVYGAVSMAAGYNEGMQRARAKYKVYLHQDVFVLYKEFPKVLLQLFQAYPRLGLLGVIGTCSLPENGVWWDSPALYGRVLHAWEPESLLDSRCAEPERPYIAAMVLDGLLLATQYDLPWQESLFDGWHFYDVSACAEFYQHGYEVGIPRQEEPWCMHTAAQKPLPAAYWHYRDVFLQHYGTDYVPAP